MQIIAEGKTKIINKKSSDTALIVSKEDLTAGNGAKHDVLKGKSVWANGTTCNVFEVLKACGIPLAYIQRESEVSFEAQLCRMLPWEVVVRRRADGSYIKRDPHVLRGALFEKLLVEFYLKTKDRKWGKYDLPCDDPLADIAEDGIYLYKPDVPFIKGTYFLRLAHHEVFEEPQDSKYLVEMAEIAKKSFLILEEAFRELRYLLVDFKVEFGVSGANKLLLADVIDNDSWRLLKNGIHMDKQGYRDGEDLETTKGKYERVYKDSKSLLPLIGYLKIWCDHHLQKRME